MALETKGKGTEDLSTNASAHATQASEAESAAEQHLKPKENMAESVEDLLYEIVDYAIIKLDTNGAVRSWNSGAAKIKGYSADEIIGKNYRIFFTSEDNALRLPDIMLDKAKKNRRTSYEGWSIRKDGERFWEEVTLTALHDKEGTVKGYVIVTHDLTAKKMADDKYGNFVEELTIQNEKLKLSEERYHTMVMEVVDYAIILLDLDGRVLEWNKGAERLKGYSASEIIGSSFRIFYPKEEKERGLPDLLLNEAITKGSATHEGWRVKKSGERFWGSIVITALHDHNGKIFGFSKVTRDLTDRKIAQDRLNILLEELHQANAGLKTSEERYHKMISEVRDYAIIFLDAQGNIQNWNSGAQLIKGYTSEEIIGKTFRIFYSKEDQVAGLPDRLLNEARVKGRVNHEGWRVRKNGSKFWGSVVITSLHNENNDIIGYSKVTRDLTDRKNAEDLLKQNTAQLELKSAALERSNAELSSFTYIASHDLREPLRKIKTFAGRIKDLDDVPAKVDEFVDKIIGSASKMQSLIGNLLAYSEVSNDEHQFEQVDLNAVLKSVITDLEILIHDKGAIIKSDTLPTVKGVSFQCYQLFLNLISNSIKFSKDHEPPLISISTRMVPGSEVPGQTLKQSGNYHFISVADQGIGFRQDQSPKIFEAFYRLNRKGPISGSGIGLAIVKKIMENHGGVITVESSPGNGAVFNLYLPF
jgi:PAS domain S-box-containing protein